jgi:hypothetical protein
MSAPAYADYAARFLGEEALLTSDADVQALVDTRLAFWWARLSAWGGDRAEATLLRVAHERQLAWDRANGQRVSGRTLTSQQAGIWSRSFSGGSGDSGERMALKQTDWGQQLLDLQERQPFLGLTLGAWS